MPRSEAVCASVAIASFRVRDEKSDARGRRTFVEKIENHFRYSFG